MVCTHRVLKALVLLLFSVLPDRETGEVEKGMLTGDRREVPLAAIAIGRLVVALGEGSGS